jgi:hypothetical protein
VSGLIERANALLTGGHVAIDTVTSDAGSRFAHAVHAYVLDGGATVVVRKSGVRWTCPCEESPCAHVIAVQLVTGQPDKARATADAVDVRGAA